ncbi:MAG: putative nitrogen regulatory PII-like protein [Methanoregula sp. PtaU1.Bin051]|nr:MAG: putative nitrogen regulatory PII-like protein [Methanoregula sp. PtaU1.Bin051]
MSGWTSPSTGNAPEVDILKLIKAIIKPERFEFVKKNLEERGYIGMTVTDVKGRGEQKGIALQYRGKVMSVDMLPKVQIEVVVRDENSNDVIALITESARTGKIGDGKIFVLPVERTIRIRTGETEG